MASWIERLVSQQQTPTAAGDRAADAAAAPRADCEPVDQDALAVATLEADLLTAFEEMASIEDEELLSEICDTFGFLDEPRSEKLYNEFKSMPIGLLEKLHVAYTSKPTTDAEQRAFKQANLYTAQNLLAIDGKRGTSEKHGDSGVERKSLNVGSTRAPSSAASSGDLSTLILTKAAPLISSDI